jgi:hypothetical protein
MTRARPHRRTLLVLVVAALVSAATSPGVVPPAQVFDEASGTVRLSAADPIALIRVSLTASRAAVDAADPWGGIVGVEVGTTASRPAPTVISVRVRPEADPADPRIAAREDTPGPVAITFGYVPFADCARDPCSVEHIIEIERKPDGPATFEVLWSVRAAIVFPGDRPPRAASLELFATAEE